MYAYKGHALKREQHSVNRFIRTTERLLHEVHGLRVAQAALRALSGQRSYGLDFFRVAYTALIGDRSIRLIRVFEDSKRVSSFWYLHRCEPKLIEKLLESTGVKISDLRDLSERLKRPRDKTAVHIDKDYVFDSTEVWEAAGIKAENVQRAIEALWLVLNELYQDRTGIPFPHDEYTGEDILRLLELRDRDIEGDK